MNRKQRIIVSVTGIFLVLLILVGLTYAYFLTRIKGNTNDKSISITTANLEIEYKDNNDIIIGDRIEPGTILPTKVFTVTNNGGKSVEYSVGLVNIINSFTTTKDVVYTITCKSFNKEGFSLGTDGTITGTENGTCSGVNETEFPTLNSYIVTNNIDVNIVHAYTMTVTYKETGIDQSDDMNKELSAKIDIFDPKSLTIQGNVTNSNDNDYVVIHSKEQESNIVDGSYRFIGITPDTHTITIKNRKTTKNLNTNLVIEKDDSQSIKDDIIIVDDTSRLAKINLNIKDNSITKTISDVSDGLSRKYQLYIPADSLVDLYISECLDNSKCSGPYTVTINNDMTINNWLKSEYVSKYINEFTNNNNIFTGRDIKNIVSNSDILKSKCGNKLSLIEDNMLYSYINTTMFTSIGYVSLRNYSSSAKYFDQLVTKVTYPDDTTILNDAFNENILFLSGNGSEICFVDTD